MCARKVLTDCCVWVNYIMYPASQTKCTYETVIWPWTLFTAPSEESGALYPFQTAFFIGIKFATAKTLGVIITVVIIRVCKYWFRSLEDSSQSEDDDEAASLFLWGWALLPWHLLTSVFDSLHQCVLCLTNSQFDKKYYFHLAPSEKVAIDITGH